MKINSNTSLKDLFQSAKDTVDELDVGEEFIVKDLFRGFEWDRIDVGNRSKLGSMIFNFSKNEGNLSILGIGKTPQNQQRYRKLPLEKDMFQRVGGALSHLTEGYDKLKDVF